MARGWSSRPEPDPSGIRRASHLPDVHEVVFERGATGAGPCADALDGLEAGRERSTWRLGRIARVR